MVKRSITVRWFLNTFCVVAAVLLAVLGAIGYFVRSSYYESAELALRSHAQSSGVTTLFASCGEYRGAEFHDKAAEYLGSFTDFNRMEVWIIDADGVVTASSSGFDVDDLSMPDYENALSNSTGASYWTGLNTNGEKVMSLTALIAPAVSGKAPAIRYITSLENTDRQFRRVILILLAVFAVTLSMVGFSGSYFIRSIVHPVEQIARSVKTVAEGNYKTEVPVKSRYSDELSELCRTFNEMSAALGDYDRMKNDFISTVSHELRTPLTAIKGWAETISACPDDPVTVSHGTGIILSETENLNVMVEDLLDFSKLESGRMRINPEKLDGVAELTETVSSMIVKADRKGLSFGYSENDGVAPVYADPLRLRQVFVNIIDNAIKYTQSGGVTVDSAITDSEFVVTVRDTGCGIPAEYLPHIKEKFFKANMSQKGSGIGLAVCDEILAMHGGKLEIGSTENEGTTVKIILPLMKGQQ